MRTIRAHFILRSRYLHPAAQALYCILVSGIIYALRSRWAYDDPFITYRYAQNLAQGVGFVYNPSERVLSTTTPFFTLLLAFIYPFCPNLPQAATFIGSTSLACSGLSLWRLGRVWKTPLVSWVGVSLYPTFPLLLNTLGSEMPLYLAFCLAAIAFYAQKRYSFCAVLSALSVLTRPDGILLALILGIDFVAHNRSSKFSTLQSSSLHRVKPVLLFTALILPWFIFAWFYFGSPIPATLATKQHQASMEISQSFIAGFANLAKRFSGNGYILIETLLALIGIMAAFFKSKRCTLPQRWLPVLAWPILYFLSYTALSVSGYFWYYAPLVPGFLIACGLGISALQQFFLALRFRSHHQANLNLLPNQPKSQPGQSASAPGLLSAAVILLCVALLALGQTQTLWAGRQRSDPRYPIYRAIGEWLRDNTSSEAHIGALEVGIIGYYAQRSMIDFAGLLQPAVALQLKPGNTYQDATLWAIENYRPEYVVLHRNIFPQVEQLISLRCTLAQQFSGASYNYTGNLDIYHCLNH